MRDHSMHIEVTREEAVTALLAQCDFDPAVEVISLREAQGRVLAEDVVSLAEMPNCLTCRMDSVAVHFDDFEKGIPDTSNWKRGHQWEFANTGIAMPEGFDAAVVIEHVQISNDEKDITINAAPSKRFAGTSAVGSRLREGELLVQSGSMLTPDMVAKIASGNHAKVPVLAKPKVAFIPTGGELVSAGSRVPIGCNIETNSFIAQGKVESWGGETIIFDIVPDDLNEIKKAVLEASAAADIVVLNAGSSKGSDDWNMEMLEDVGQVLFHQTNHGPGHHSSGAVVNNTPIVGISGPPFGASFTLNFYLRPTMMKFLQQPTAPEKIRVRLTEGFPKGGPSNSGRDASKPLAGEERPSVLTEEKLPPADGRGKGFYGVKFLTLSQAEDATLMATPISGRPGAPAFEAANVCYMLHSGTGIEQPHAGDIIEVELR